MNFLHAESTHIGSRKNNQDYMAHLIGPNWSCFMMADGLGGHQSGEIASEYFVEAVKALCTAYVNDIEADPITSINNLIIEAGTRFRHRVAINHGLIDTQTTFCLVWISSKHLTTAHIGDSRIYKLQQNKTVWRTKDHTIAQRYFDQGKITEEEISRHPLQNRLLRTVNTYATPKAEISLHSTLKSDESILLCTDGFWAAMDQSMLTQLYESKQLDAQLKNFVEQIALSNPKSDNVTAQWVHIS